MLLSIIDLLPQSWVMPVALALFLLTYVGLLLFSKYRAFIALGSALIFIIIGLLPLDEIFTAIDWNVIMMIAGTMGVVALFIESKMPALIADKIIDKSPNVMVAILLLSIFAGIVSAFIDNVATVLMIAPIALDIAKKLKINPIPPIIALSVASNLEGAATLVGDTTSILLGGYAKMDFLDFFVYQGKIGLFFIVQIGLLVSTFVLYLIFRKYKQPISIDEKTEVTNYFPSFLMIGVVVLLILASFIPNKPSITNGLICMSLMVVGIVHKALTTRQKGALKATVKEIDFFTLGLLAGLFMVIASITNAGVIDAIANAISSISGGDVFIIYTVIVFMSVIISAFVDNIPYVATMLPVMVVISSRIGLADPTVLFFGLLIGATLGGNMTPIGASANITSIGILRKAGYDVKTMDFMRIGVPYTLAAVVTGYLLVWFIFA